MSARRMLILAVAILSAASSAAQHPDKKKIDSLEQRLSTAVTEKSRIDCQNAIGEEFWWPSTTAADTITYWADLGLRGSQAIHYSPGEAKAMMLRGVGEIFRKNYRKAEKDLRIALAIYEEVNSDFGLGWCNVWLGQALYSQDKFDEALRVDKRSAVYMAKTGDWEGQGKAWSWIGMIYATLGDYDSSFAYSSKSLQLREIMSDHLCVFLSYINMGQLYKAAGSNRDALDYFERGFTYAAKHQVTNGFINWTYFEVVGTLYRFLDLPDSASYFLQKSIHVDSTNEMTHISYGEALLMQNQVDSALQIFLRPVNDFRAGNDNWDLMRVLMDASRAYYKKSQYRLALTYANETYSIASKTGARPFIMEVYLLLSKLYNAVHANDSAYYYLGQFTTLKDSVVNNQFLWKLSGYKKQEDFRNKSEQVVLLVAENQAKEAKLKSDRFFDWIMFAGFFITLLSAFFIYKNLNLKRKNEKLEERRKQADLLRHVGDLEMQALRAQMNPHFIFNCLSSINSFILKNENDLASTYLTRFSRLVRLVLSNSKKSFIGIEEELEMLCLYLDLEKLRFRDSFDYKIRYLNSFDTGNVLVPPLLLQPFAENAIWHGLLHRSGFGRLEIELREENGILICVIADNGIGRGKAAEIKSKSLEKRKSMGLQITAERLALLNNENERSTFFAMDDVLDAAGKVSGTKVTLKVRYRQLCEVSI